MKLTKRNDLITLSRQEVARAIGEYVQREHERLTGEAGLPLVMSTEDGELNGQPVPQLKVSGSNRQIGTLRLDAVVVEVDNCATRRRAKDEDGIVREGKKTLADLKANAPQPDHIPDVRKMVEPTDSEMLDWLIEESCTVLSFATGVLSRKYKVIDFHGDDVSVGDTAREAITKAMRGEE